MKVYRVQDKEGRGPFKPGLTRHWLIYNKGKDKLIPWYAGMNSEQIKALLSGRGAIGTACISIKDLCKWFSKKEYSTLLKHGYRSIYLDINEEDVLFKDDNQILFNRDIPLNEQITAFNLY